MKNKSWNETWTINKAFQISDQNVVTGKHQQDLTCSPGHHKGTTYDGKKESQRIIYKHKRRLQDRWSKSWIQFHKNFNKLVKILQKSQTSEISKADEKQKLERDMDK